MLFAPAFAALVISISSTADVSPTLVDRAIDEATAIWRSAGVSLVRQRSASEPAAIDVVIGPDRGAAQTGNAPLGWIEFDDGQPQRRLYLSYANAIALLDSSGGITGAASRMPVLQRETYLGRAMGRALAHELGHYLLAMKTHTSSGLMKANFTAFEFFAPEAPHFAISASERTLAVARLEHAPAVASAMSGSTSPRSPDPASRPRAAARWPGPIPN